MSTSVEPERWRPTATLAALHARGHLLAETRRFFAERNVLEVQTPVLAAHGVTDPSIEAIRSADGRFLQSSPEYHMKRLLAAGTPSIYQIAPAFRAGEAGRWHNPEFTMLEWYRLGLTTAALRDEIADLIRAVLGPGEIVTITYLDCLARAPGVRPDDDVWTDAIAIANRLGARDLDHPTALDFLISRALERLGGRVFVIDYPVAQAALARVIETPGGVVADRFELVIDGVEIANGYGELRDAAELERRFHIDNDRRVELGRDTVPLDAPFLSAHAAGLPVCAGVALGFDRLLALKLGAASLAEVVAFAGTHA